VTERDLDVGAAEAGIHRLSIPTPFAVGRVNVYLIEDEPLTLVDAGPNSGTSLEALSQALGAHGRAIEDLELLVISHQHIDHLGLTGLLAARSGAEVAAIDVLAPYVEHYSEHAEADDQFATGVMLANGIPSEVVSALQSVSRAFRAWGARADVDRVLRPGDALTLRDRTFTVHHRPGHSPTDTVFHDAQRRMLIAADHLLPHISSNPLITRPPEEGGERPKALLTYMDSLRRTREMDLDVLLPGHGDPFTGHADLIDRRFALHTRRAEKLYGLIAERPRTAYELAQALWGNIAVTQAFLTLSEVLGHTDLLERDGRVRAVSEDGVTRFEAVS
jgi:glyoxylase-like metal-dependent hydrolase (beta-lactamase superfamily II)